ncbi:YheC/YheD family protein [Marininema halotolerans]|uniref:Glycosyltransferase Family 4 n=1 Tax=Marininema halotolerans TaxID=1155944 RepID=A0A1I6R787_9BACL|nr:YheC/YheD family protein [Marininema halotolerans]SFS60573.1 Glycosyltransferase Family 4 [Marininema halotolerans]
MAYEVGVLFCRTFFKECLRGHQTNESFDLYNTYARQAGIEPVFFTLRDISYRDHTVRGVVSKRSGGYERSRVPLPSLIHNRVKPRSKDMGEWYRLSNLPGVTLFNADNRLDKWDVYRWLHSDPIMRMHLPETARATVPAMNQLFLRHASLYLKPSNKSLGMGIRRMNQRGAKIDVALSRHPKSFALTRSFVVNKLGKWTRGGSYLLQQGISFMTYNGKPMDIRVSVQRGEDGQWHISGMVAKVAPAGRVATNMALGGKAYLLDPILASMGFDPVKVREDIARVSLRAADVLSNASIGLTDLGLDVGIDSAGKVWIIEVNARDLRITFRQAKDWTAWSTTFARPMQYAAYLLRNREAQEKETKIAWITPGALTITGKASGSVETAARETVKRLGKELGKEMPIYLFGKGIGLVQGVKPVEIRASSEKEYWKRAIPQLRYLRPRVIHVENRPDAVMKVKHACPRGKIILYAHSENYFKPPWIDEEALNHALQSCDRLLTNSHYLKSRFVHRFPHFAPRIEVLPLGVDTTLFPDRMSPLGEVIRGHERERMGLKDEKVLLFLGRLLPQKGVHHLIRALPKIQERHPQVRLIIVGGSHYGRNESTTYVRQLHHISRRGLPIQWVDFVPHHRVPAYYAVADLLVMPSMGEEAFGLVNLEAMASGLPVVSVRTGGIPEVVDDGVTGVLIPGQNPVDELAEACSLLLSDPDRMKEYGWNGRQRVEKHFTWERTVEQTKALYSRLQMI